MDEQLIRHALALLREDPVYIDDARVGAPIGNSIVGSILNLTLKAPRWATEQAVVEALALLDDEEQSP